LPTPVVTPQRTPIPTLPPIWDPNQAQTQLDNVHRAIQNSVDTFGFDRQADVDALIAAADAVQTPLTERNRSATAQAVQALSHTLQEIVNAGRLHNPQELQQTVANLVSAVGLP
jgi:hypothetical protein